MILSSISTSCRYQWSIIGQGIIFNGCTFVLVVLLNGFQVSSYHQRSSQWGPNPVRPSHESASLTTGPPPRYGNLKFLLSYLVLWLFCRRDSQEKVASFVTIIKYHCCLLYFSDSGCELLQGEANMSVLYLKEAFLSPNKMQKEANCLSHGYYITGIHGCR